VNDTQNKFSDFGDFEDRTAIRVYYCGELFESYCLFDLEIDWMLFCLIVCDKATKLLRIVIVGH
jgi:hypothetical protein